MSAQARIGSSSAHFTSIALSPCSTRKCAALEGGGGGGLSARGGLRLALRQQAVVAFAQYWLDRPAVVNSMVLLRELAVADHPMVVAAVAPTRRSRVVPLQQRNIQWDISTLSSP